MENDLEILRAATVLFAEDQEGTFLKGNFQHLFLVLKTFPNPANNKEKKLVQLFGYITEDFWNISQILGRLDWTKQKTIEDEESEFRWTIYASLDVQQIHYEFRSIMDYAAQAIGEVYGFPKKKSESFERLSNWSRKNPQKVDNALYVELNSTSWFGQIRGIRNLLLHLGGSTLIFGKPTEGILFQIYKENFHKIIDKNYILYNENVAYFEKYFAVYFSNLLVFLDKLSVMIAEQLGRGLPEDMVKNYGIGFQIAKSWIDGLISEIEQK